MTDTSKSENKPDTAEAKIREILDSKYGYILGPSSTNDDLVQQLKGLLVEARKAQSAATSDWIEKHIRMLHKDSLFKNVSSSVAFTYAKAQLLAWRDREVRVELECVQAMLPRLSSYDGQPHPLTKDTHAWLAHRIKALPAEPKEDI